MNRGGSWLGWMSLGSLFWLGCSHGRGSGSPVADAGHSLLDAGFDARGDGGATDGPPLRDAGDAETGTPVPAVDFLTCDAVLPKGVGVVDVTDSRFGAVGDGVHDDTNAILEAIAFGATGPTLTAAWTGNYVYLPPGTYRVSNTIQKLLAKSSLDAAVAGRCGEDAGTWPSGGHPDCYIAGMMLVGAGPDKTIIKLIDDAPGFTDPTHPKAVIFTSSSFFDSATNKDYANLGEGNDAYSNFVECMTVDVGAGNTGAIGVDYLGNNGGAVRSVLARAATGSGASGISMIREWPGPALVENVWVEGFDVGIDAAQSTYTMTMQHIELHGQRSFGIRSADHPLSIEDLSIVGAPTPLTVSGSDALTVLVNASLSAGTLPAASATEAFVNAGAAHLRNVTVAGYKTLLGAPVTSSPVEGIYLALTRTEAATASFSRTGEDPPALDAKAIATPSSVNDGSQWASVKTLGAKGDGDTDDTTAIQAALKAAPVVYFPPGVYRVNGNLAVPSSVRMIKGFMSALMPCGYAPSACNGETVGRAASFSRTAGVLVFAPTEAPVVVEKLHIGNDNLGGQMGYEIAGGSFPVVMRDVISAGAPTSRDASGGPLYIESYAGGTLTLAGSAPVFVRQLDIEGNNPAVSNAGSPLWVLGMKSEGNVTWANTTAGGTTEILGGLIYMVDLPPSETPVPALINTDSNTLATFAEAAFVTTAAYTDYLQSTVGGTTTNVLAASFPTRGDGHMATLVSSGK
jgi:hypothetical protein